MLVFLGSSALVRLCWAGDNLVCWCSLKRQERSGSGRGERGREREGGGVVVGGERGKERNGNRLEGKRGEEI